MAHPTPEQELEELLIGMGLRNGANALMSRVVAVLFTEPRPLTMEELSQHTGYSLSAISGAVKLLENIGKIRRIKQPGEKRARFEFERNLIKSIHDQFERSMTVVVKPMQEKMPHIIKGLQEELKSGPSAERTTDIKNKISWYKCYLQQLEELEKLSLRMEAEFKKLVAQQP